MILIKYLNILFYLNIVSYMVFYCVFSGFFCLFFLGEVYFLVCFVMFLLVKLKYIFLEYVLSIIMLCFIRF